MARKPWMVSLVNDEGWTGGEFGSQEVAEIAARAFVAEIGLKVTVQTCNGYVHVGDHGTVTVRRNVPLG